MRGVLINMPDVGDMGSKSKCDQVKIKIITDFFVCLCEIDYEL